MKIHVPMHSKDARVASFKERKVPVFVGREFPK